MSSNKSRFYIAYGSNLNLQQMKHRCPTAEVVGTAVLRNWKLWFRRSRCHSGTGAGLRGAGAGLADSAPG